MRGEAGDANTDEAVVWALRLKSGLLTEADVEGLGDWLANRPDRLAALARALAALTPVVQTTPAVGPEAEQQPLSRRRFLANALVAGAGVAVVGGGLLYVSGRHSYATDVGEMGHVLLPDGSMAILNTDTEIVLAFTASDRYVKLTRGEALFDLELDMLRPFSLEACGLLVQTYGALHPTTIREDHTSLGALIDYGRDIARPLTQDPSRTGFEARGTTFATRIKPGDRVETIVLEGNVEVRLPASKRSAPIALASNTRLSAWPGGDDGVHAIDTQSLENKLAWLRRAVVLGTGATIGVAAEEFNRYNELRLVVGERIANRQIRGTFEVDRPVDFVRTVEQATHARVRFGGGMVTIS